MSEKKNGEADKPMPISPNSILSDNGCKDNEESGININPSLLRLISNPKDEPIDTSTVGSLKIKQAKVWMKEAVLKPNPRPLFYSLWNEGEICVMFADTNVGKSILAVQICDDLSKNHVVLYIDFELSDKQFQIRYTDEKGNIYSFNDNFLRAEFDLLNADEEIDLEQQIIDDIETAILNTHAEIVVIDNLSFVCNQQEKGAEAGSLINKLKQMQRKLNISLLVLAHTPKRVMTKPLTQNDLAGSKRIANFVDSIFACGFSAKGDNMRYIIQIKTRNGAKEYGENNVLCAEIKKVEGFTKFIMEGTSDVKDHLKEWEGNERNQAIIQSINEGKSYREVANEFGISKTQVGKILNNK